MVLSGGGARGFAHIGVLKAMNEHDIYPDIISAVSAGSIVGAFYADGYTPDEIFEIIQELDAFKVLRLNRPALGMLKADGLRKVMQHKLRHKNLEDLQVPLIVSATNFTKAQTTYFSEGSLVDAVLASSAIPLILKPMMLKGDMYVDGGLMNNLPVEPLIGHCSHIIGVNVNPVTEVSRFRSFRNYADRVMHLAIRANVQNNIQKCDWYLEPPHLMDFHIFKVSSAKEIFELGYRYANEYLDQKMR